MATRIMKTKQIQKIAKKYHVKSLRIFGSFARGNCKPSSDVDILVELKRNVGYFGFIRLEDELSGVFNRRVDLVTKDALSTYFRDEVLSEAKEVYRERR